MPSYSIDTVHSEIGFTVRHMMFAKVHGQFKSWSATLDYDAEHPEKSTVRVEIDTSSIDTREAQRDTHLRSAEFLDCENSPKMVFQSKRIESAGKTRFKVIGELTIRGISKEVTLDVEATGSGKDPWGNERLGFSAQGSINRSDWGLKWNQALEAGGVLVSDKVDIEAEQQVVHAK